MPLVQCPECQREISDRAPSCPGCGFPMAAAGPPPAAVGAPPPPPPRRGVLGLETSVPKAPPIEQQVAKRTSFVKFQEKSKRPSALYVLAFVVILAMLYGLMRWDDVGRYTRRKMEEIFGGASEKVPQRKQAPNVEE